jgi:hypothetical protein
MLIHPKHQEGATRQVKDSANDSKPGVKAQQQQQHAAVQDPEARAKLRRVVAGVLTGVTERFLSHPVETCKVVLQNTPASASAVQVISSRWRDKGLASFYRGTTTNCYYSRLCRVLPSPLPSISASLSSLTPITPSSSSSPWLLTLHGQALCRAPWAEASRLRFASTLPVRAPLLCSLLPPMLLGGLTSS